MTMTPDKRNMLIQKLRVRQTTISDEVADMLKADGIALSDHKRLVKEAVEAERAACLVDVAENSVAAAIRAIRARGVTA